jgi:hypothetical protein
MVAVKNWSITAAKNGPVFSPDRRGCRVAPLWRDCSPALGCKTKPFVKWAAEMDQFFTATASHIARSSKTSRLDRLVRQGILVPNAGNCVGRSPGTITTMKPIYTGSNSIFNCGSSSGSTTCFVIFRHSLKDRALSFNAKYKDCGVRSVRESGRLLGFSEWNLG